MLIAFREWRRTRPFWGGLLIVLAAAEILSTTVLSLGPVFRVGLGGVNAFAGDIITVVLGVCGLLLWFSPAQRVFYSVVSLILALATFNTINYGGFFLGMLLGIVGGAMAFAWSPGPVREESPRPVREESPGPVPAEPPEPPTEPGPPEDQNQDARPGSVPPRLQRGWFWRQGHTQGAGTSGRDRVLAIAAPLAGLLLLAPVLPGQRSAGSLTPSSSGCILVILCPPTKSPSPSPTPSSSTPGPPRTPSPSPRTSGPAGSQSPTPAPGGPGPAGHAGRAGKGRVKRTAPPPGLIASGVPAVLSAGSARLVGLAYDGVAEVPRSSGGPVAMMKFTLRSVTLTGNPTLTVRQDGSVATTTMSLLSLRGNVILYATRLSGNLLGAGLTITPSSPLSLVVRLLRPLTQGLTLTMTHVVTDQPIALAAASRWDNYRISVS